MWPLSCPSFSSLFFLGSQCLGLFSAVLHWLPDPSSGNTLGCQRPLSWTKDYRRACPSIEAEGLWSRLSPARNCCSSSLTPEDDVQWKMTQMITDCRIPWTWSPRISQRDPRWTSESGSSGQRGKGDFTEKGHKELSRVLARFLVLFALVVRGCTVVKTH